MKTRGTRAGSSVDTAPAWSYDFGIETQDVPRDRPSRERCP